MIGSAERTRRWRERNPEKAQAANAAVAARRNALLEAQGGVCAICGTDSPGSAKGWHLDHDHTCCPGNTLQSCGACDRGVLCYRCNVLVVPIMERDPSLLPKALQYLSNDK